MVWFYLPLIISAKIQPTLQMSTGLLYEEWSNTSGALYHCVTTWRGGGGEGRREGKKGEEGELSLIISSEVMQTHYDVINTTSMFTGMHVDNNKHTCVDKTTLDPMLLESPRSAIFSFFPSQLTRIFCGLRSRCTMLFTCIQSTPSRI